MNGYIIGELINGGEPVIYLKKKGYWYKANYKGSVDYVYKNYVTLYKDVVFP